MARIRSIKPEFWTSEQVVTCTPMARLLFIGIWTFCDDNGIHPASVTRLKLQIFPADRISNRDLQNLIDELVGARLLTEYQASSDRYWQVTGWAKHQRIEKPTYRHPLPVIEPGLLEFPKPVGDISTTSQGVVDTSAGTERSGYGLENTLSDKSDCMAVLHHLNLKAGTRYRPVDANIRLIAARLREGASVEDCKSVIDAKVSVWSNDPKMNKYLRPATLFNAEKFAQYVGEIGDQPKGVQWE